MRFLKQWIMDTLGFSKAEANGTLVMILIILIAAILPKLYLSYQYENHDKSNSSPDELKQWADQLSESIQERKEEKTQQKLAEAIPVPPPKKFPFDPNNSSKEDLIALGFSSRVAFNITKYTAIGGQFKIKNDLNKIYGIDQTRVKELWNYIELPELKDDVKDEPIVVTNEEKVIKTYRVNNVRAEELEEIKGIGPFLSKQITEYRDRLGGFHSQHQLKEVYGLSDELLLALETQLVFTDSLRTIDINTDSIKHFSRHPYIEYYVAKAIYAYRKQHGTIDSVAQIKSIKIMSDSLYQRISPYLSVYP